MTLHVGCSSSTEYLPHAATMLRSMLSHADGMEVHAHLLHGPSMPSNDAARVVEMVERAGGTLTLHEIAGDQIAGLPSVVHAGIPPTMWYRIFLPELLRDVDRLLYVDVDTVAVASLRPLWDTELGDHYLAAVTNVWEPWNAGYPTRLGMPLDGPNAYFNSGVILMNLDLMRRDDCTRRLQEWAREHAEEIIWGDQDALNALLGDRRLALHPRWNCMNSILTFPRRSSSSAARRSKRLGPIQAFATSRVPVRTSPGTSSATATWPRHTCATALRPRGRASNGRG